MMIRASGAQRFRITASDQLKHGLWIADVERLALLDERDDLDHRGMDVASAKRDGRAQRKA